MFGTGIVKNKSEKGDYAESLVNNYLLLNGYECFTPSGLKAHLFDGMALRKIDNIELFLYDVKSKAARNFHKDTGVDLKHFKHYMEMVKFFNKKFYVYFVDEELGYIYKQNLNEYYNNKYITYNDEDDIVYPKIENNEYIYFSLETMIKVRKLTKEERIILRGFSKTTNKNYKFNPIWKEQKLFKD